VLAQCAAGCGGDGDFFEWGGGVGGPDRRSGLTIVGGAILQHGALGGDDLGRFVRLGRFRRLGLLGFAVAVFEVADDVADNDHVAFLLEDLAEDARGRRGKLHRGFVGFELDEIFVEGDGVAFALQPTADLHFMHRFADFRNL
jgi:hypothetical protein